MSPLPAVILAALLAGPAAAEPSSLSEVLKRVSAYLTGPVKRAPRRPAVAAVRGGIPTEMGEDLDGRLLDRALALRAAMNRPDASGADEAALRPIYEALAASQYVQALSIVGAPETREEAAASLASWAKEPRRPGLPAGVIALLTGPSARIDDKALVAAGWGRHARALAPSGASAKPAAPGWDSSEEAARLDETLKGLSDSWLERKLTPEDEARAHFLAGQVYAELAKAPLRGRAPEKAATAPASAPAPADGAPPAEAQIPFEPRAVYQKASKSVVLIACTGPDGAGELGTGSVVDAARKLVLTNAHVVVRDSTRKPWPRISLYFKPARLSGDPKRDLTAPIEGKVVAWDSGLDLALVELDRLPERAAALALGHPGGVSIGDRVAAIGHPEQGGLWTLTTGVVSTVLADLGGVEGKDVFQTDASINRGNSGGPLLDAYGRLVGVNTSMSRKAADGLAITSVNFSVKSDVARRWMAAKGRTLAYGRASAPAAALAAVPQPVPAPVAASAPKTRAKPVMITESKPFVWDAIIDSEIEKLEELGEEMHQEIKRRSGR